MVKSPNQIDKSLGSRLRDKRASIGWSREELGEKLEIDAKEIGAFERGEKRISADLLLRLSKLLQVRPVYFFGINEKGLPSGRQPRLHSDLLDQGLRLHRAFVGVRNPALREEIVSLVIEIAKRDDSE